jgi:proline utilization trans-activator
MEAQRLSSIQTERSQPSPRHSATIRSVNSSEFEGPRADLEMNNTMFHLSEPSLEELLSFPHLDIDTLEIPFDNDGIQSFYWPDGNIDGGGPDFLSNLNN